MQNKQTSNRRRKLIWQKIALYAGFAAAVIVFICVLAFLLFSDPLVNRFVKPRITKAFAEAYPAYSIRIGDMNYSVLKNRFGFDSVSVIAVDSTFAANIGLFSVKRIGWMHLLWGGSITLNDFAGSSVNAQDIIFKSIKLHYEIRCEKLSLSVPDSEIVVEAVKLQPPGDDEQFFKSSKFRETRIRLVVPNIKVMGLACLELLQGKMYLARSVKITDPSVDVLVNKDKANIVGIPSPLMPNELLSSIKQPLQVDGLYIMNGRLKYSERFEIGSNPAWLTFDSLQVLVEGISNHVDRGTPLVIHTQGSFANTGRINMLMSIPVASPDLSLQYSGSASRIDLSALNSFIEISDQMRIKTGVLEESTFEIKVVSGHASGVVRNVYRDMVLASITKQTGSEKGLSNNVTSFFANAFKIRKNNLEDKSGSLKIGIVNYTRERDDTFIRFLWFALRSGIRDVMGF